jgi:hypothetical protein
MQGLMRIVCVAYLILLTALLLTGDPLRLVGVRGDVPWLLRMALPFAHLLSFFVLAILALTTQWPIPRWGVLVALVAYGALTEVLQGYTPKRTSEWRDWLQDVGGIVIGAVLCWGAVRVAGASAGFRRRLLEWWT